MPQLKTKSFKVHNRYKIKYWMLSHICGFILNYTLVKTFKGCVGCQVIQKEIRCCRMQSKNGMIQFQHAVFLSRLPYNSQDELHDFSIKVEQLENDGVLHIRDKEKNVRNKALKPSQVSRASASEDHNLQFKMFTVLSRLLALTILCTVNLAWSVVCLADDYRKLMEFELNDRNNSLIPK